MKKLLLALMMMLTITSFSQVIPNKDFVVQALSPTGLDVTGVASAIDFTTGAVYTCGFFNSPTTGKDLILVKLDSNGVQLWVATYDFTSLDDKANAVCVDGSGNVYVTGGSYQGSGNMDIVTIKYNSSGTQQWVSRVNGTNNTNDMGNSILFDGTNVWVTGYVTTTSKGKDAVILKLNGSSGATIASPKRNGTANADDIGEKICSDGASVFITGTTKNTTTNGDVFVACLNISSATLTWSISVNGSANGDDSGLDIKIDNGELFTCGYTNNTTTGNDYYFARIKKSNGTIKYSNTYDGGYNGSDLASAFVADKLGKYAVTGYITNGSNNEYHTRLYDTSSVLWTHVQPINGAFTSSYPKIALDTIAQHFYVCGTYSNSTLDGLLYQIAPSGNKIWTHYHASANGARDIHTDIVLDGLGRIFLCSPNETGTATNIYDYMVIRYSQTPVYMPVNYNMLADTFSMAHLYYPNVGQVKDTSGNDVDEVLFYANFGSPKDYILKNKIAFCETRRDSFGLAARRDSLSRVDMIFDGANEFSEIFPIDFQTEAILNYFIADTNGITDIAGASHLICPNIYPQIDLHYSSNEKGSKYYFVVKPTGDPNVIRMRFDGAASTATVSNKLVITSEFGAWEFKKPDIYNVSVPSFTNLTITTTSITGTTGWVSLGSDTYSINPGSYNTAWPLVIEFDMGKSTATVSATDNMSWSTYFGGSTEDVGYSVENDNSNNTYIGGYTLGGAFPTTTGAYQTVYTAGDPRSGVLIKFNSNKSMAWATYYGGTDGDEILAIEFDNSNSRLYAVGYTFSTDFPLKNKSGATTSAAFHGSGAAADGFIADFIPSTGLLSWSNVIGGNGDDRAMDIRLDGSGNKYVIGNASTGVTTLNPGGAYMQSVYGGGFSDGMIVKFTSADVLNWLTYYGGSNVDYFHSIGVDAANSVYIMGHTNSTNMSTMDPSIPGDVYYATNAGGFDWFLGKFNSSGVRQWATYYGGANDEYSTREKGIVSIGNETYFYGTTASSGLITQQFASMVPQTFQGGNDTYVLAINTNYTPLWATYHGGTDGDYAGGITKDAAGNIYFTGSTFSSDFPYTIPPSYYSQSFIGASHGSAGWFPEGGDAFVSAYATNRNLVWSTWVGGGPTLHPSGDDIGYGISVSANNKLYITGGTSSRSPFYPSYNPGMPAYYSSPSAGFGTSDIIISEFNIASLPLVGINENNLKNYSYIVYPNPTANKVYISNAEAKSLIEVFDIRGGKVKEVITRGGKEEVNLEAFANGVYFIKITDKSGLYETHKIIKTE